MDINPSSGSGGPISRSPEEEKKKEIVDIATWCQAFLVLAAIHLATSGYPPEQAGGLMAYLHHIIKMLKDLGEAKWLKYDPSNWLWAGAKKASNSGELNLSLYKKCIAGPPAPKSPTVASRPSTK